MCVSYDPSLVANDLITPSTTKLRDDFIILVSNNGGNTVAPVFNLNFLLQRGDKIYVASSAAGVIQLFLENVDA